MIKIAVMARIFALGSCFLACTPALAGTDTFIYDALGRVITVIRANGTTTSYSYDAADNRTTVVTASNTPGTWGNFNWNDAAWHN